MAKTETLRYGLIELDDALRKEGRLQSFGMIEHALSDAQGHMEASTVDLHGSDVPDRPIGTRLSNASTKFFQRDEMAVYAVSSVGRAAGATPRAVSRTLLQDDSYGSSRGSSVEFEFRGTDPLFCDGGAFGPDQTFPLYKFPRLAAASNGGPAVTNGLVVTQQSQTGGPTWNGSCGALTNPLHACITTVVNGIESNRSPTMGNVPFDPTFGIRVNWGSVQVGNTAVTYRIYLFDNPLFNPLTGKNLDGSSTSGQHCRVFTHDNTTYDGFNTSPGVPNPWEDFFVQIGSWCDGVDGMAGSPLAQSTGNVPSVNVSGVFNPPVDVYNKYMPVIIGEKSDQCAVDPVTGAPASKGLCPLIYLGQDALPTGANGTGEPWGMFFLCLYACYKILALYGSDLGSSLYGIGNLTTDAASPNSTLTLGGSPNLASVAVGAQITVYASTGIKTFSITAVNVGASQVTVNGTVTTADVTFNTVVGTTVGADWIIGTPSGRASINLNTRNGVDVMVPGWPGYIRPTPYEDFQDADTGDIYRGTWIWVRGPLLNQALRGAVTLAANVIGVEDKGDGTGLPITDYFTAYNWWLTNCVITKTKRPSIGLATGGPGYWPQTAADLVTIGATFSDGTAIVRGSSFVTAQTISVNKIGGRGYQVNAYFGGGTSSPAIRDVMALWNSAAWCRTGVNEHGQVFVSLFDTTQDPTTWPRVEHVSRVFGPVIRTNPQAETENVVQGQYDYDPDAQRYRNPLLTVTSSAGVLHNKGIQKKSGVIDGQLTANTNQFTNVLKDRLAYAQDGPVYVTFVGDVGLLDYPLGSGIQFTSPMGPGSVGYASQPLWIIKKSLNVDTHLVTLTCLDVGGGSGMGTLVTAAQQFLVTDNSLTAPQVTDSASLAPVVIV